MEKIQQGLLQGYNWDSSWIWDTEGGHCYGCIREGKGSEGGKLKSKKSTALKVQAYVFSHLLLEKLCVKGGIC